MKKQRVTLSLLLVALSGTVMGQSSDDVLNLLQSKGTITAAEADSLRSAAAIAKWSSLKNRSFGVDLEFRPRTEFRYGYSALPDETSTPAFFTSQRTRLTFNFHQKGEFRFLTTLQDVRVWGDKDFRSTAGTVQIYEAWVEPVLSPELTLRFGRQRLIYDNERLFAQNNWRQTGSSYDAAVLKYEGNGIVNDLVVAWNQHTEQTFSTAYTSPSSSNPYFKALIFNFTTFSPVPAIKLTSLQVADGFEDPDYSEKINFRFTNGGRIDWKSGDLSATLASYYQWGTVTKGRGKEFDLSAWYAQPEVKLTVEDFTYRLGAEVLSGTGSKFEGTDHSFVPLYGVAHRFNGFMDQITSFPSHIGDGGLINPYFFTSWKLNPTITLNGDIHGFWSYAEVLDSKQNALKPYLGTELDLVVLWKVNNYTNLEAGFSLADWERSFTTIRKAGDPSLVNHFTYLQLTWRPTLFFIEQ